MISILVGLLFSVLLVVGKHDITLPYCASVSPHLCEYEEIYKLLWSPDGNWLAVLHGPHGPLDMPEFTVDILYVPSGELQTSVRLFPMDSLPYTFLWSPNSEKLLIIGDRALINGRYEHWLSIIDVHTTEVEHHLYRPYWLGNIIWSPDSRMLALWYNRAVMLFQLDTGMFVPLAPLDDSSVQLSFSPDATLLLGVLSDGTLRVWQIAATID